MTAKREMKKEKKIPKRFFKNKRLEIIRVLIDELQCWESAEKPTNEEMFRLVDRLERILTPL